MAGECDASLILGQTGAMRGEAGRAAGTLVNERQQPVAHVRRRHRWFAPEKAKASLALLLDTAEKRARALARVMRIAGPAGTMHPKALALYKELESLLGRRAPPAGEVPTGDAEIRPEQRSA
jgi:hypothetical protein